MREVDRARGRDGGIQRHDQVVVVVGPWEKRKAPAGGQRGEVQRRRTWELSLEPETGVTGVGGRGLLVLVLALGVIVLWHLALSLEALTIFAAPFRFLLGAIRARAANLPYC